MCCVQQVHYIYADTQSKGVLDSSQLLTNANSKINQSTTKAALWINVCSKRHGFQEEFRDTGLQPLRECDGTTKEKKKIMVTPIHEEDAHQPQEVSNVFPYEEEEVVEELLLDDANNDLSHDNLCEALSIVASLKTYTRRKDLKRGGNLHAYILRKGLLAKNVFIGSALVTMYAKWGQLQKAQEVFDQLQVRNIVSWNALIAGYAQYGHGEEALECFNCMQLEGVSPDAVTFVCILKACGSIGRLEKGQDLHAQIMREKLLETNIVVANALVDMYAKCSLVGKAQEVFDAIPMRDVVSWNSLIAGYAQNENGDEALKCFDRMQCEGLAPNASTFACILKACSAIRASKRGRELHAQIVGEPLLEATAVVATGLVDMYAKCGLIEKAQELFDELPAHSVGSWNAIIAGNAQHRQDKEALDCFKQMKVDGLSPDSFTYACVLKACGSLRALDEGQRLHGEILRHGLFAKQIHVGTALVDMYTKCQALEKAKHLFFELSSWNVISWTALISGYAQYGHDEEAMKLLKQMQHEGISPNEATYACILKLYGSKGTVEKGKELHAQVSSDGLLEDSMVVGTALVDMYAACGMLMAAQEVFDRLPVCHGPSWIVLMAGYAKLGRDESVFELFHKFLGEGQEVDCGIFTILFNVCCHTGLLNKGQACFEIMTKGYGMFVTLEHLTCMVDLYGRAGHLDEVVAVVEETPCFPDLLLWHTLLGAFQKWENWSLAKWAFEHAAQLDEKDGAVYVTVSNIPAFDGMEFKEPFLLAS